MNRGVTLMIKEIKIHIKHKVENKSFLYKLILTFFICGVIFSMIGIKNGESDINLYMFCLFASSCSFSFVVILTPLNEKKQKQIFYKISIYAMMLIITAISLVFWVYVYLGGRGSVILYIFMFCLLLGSILFLINLIVDIFKFTKSIIDKFFSKIFNNKFSNTVLWIKNITSIIATITTFLATIISLLELLSKFPYQSFN